MESLEINSKTHIKLRDFSPADFESVNLLWSGIGLGGKHRGDTPDIIMKTLQQGGRLLILFVEETSEIIGTSWLTTDSRRTYLHHFGIAENWQGMKLADYLLDETLKIARLIGLQVKLEVHESNMKAISLYRKYGFQYLGDYEVYIIRDLNLEVSSS